VSRVGHGGLNSPRSSAGRRGSSPRWPRSFADPGDLGQGVIAAKWNVAGTPTLYVIDPKGVMRYKWVGSPGEKAIDAALDTLSKEAEGSGKNPPK
jgi:hypothetical protein